MIKIELFGKSCIFGLVGRRFRFHCVTAERIKTFKSLVFRVHPTDVRRKMARVDFKNGYSVEVVPVKDGDGLYYDVTATRGKERYKSLSYCTEKEMDGILEYFQTR